MLEGVLPPCNVKGGLGKGKLGAGVARTDLQLGPAQPSLAGPTSDESQSLLAIITIHTDAAL